MSDVERLSIAKLRFAGGKEHDVNYVSEVHYDAALAREAQLRVDRDDDANTFNLAVEKLQRSEAALREELRLAKELQTTTDAIVVMVDGQRDHWIEKCRGLKQRLTVAEQWAGELEKALKFYADGDHLLLADADAWDTCSGEPANFLHDEAGTASVEDGSIAKAALKPVAELESAQGLPGTSGMRLNMLANQGE